MPEITKIANKIKGDAIMKSNAKINSNKNINGDMKNETRPLEDNSEKANKAMITQCKNFGSLNFSFRLLMNDILII